MCVLTTLHRGLTLPKPGAVKKCDHLSDMGFP